jgi:hypothetical protein
VQKAHAKTLLQPRNTFRYRRGAGANHSGGAGERPGINRAHKGEQPSRLFQNRCHSGHPIAKEPNESDLFAHLEMDKLNRAMGI